MRVSIFKIKIDSKIIVICVCKRSTKCQFCDKDLYDLNTHDETQYKYAKTDMNDCYEHTETLRAQIQENNEY